MALADSSETGLLGVMHLKRIWSASMEERQGRLINRKAEKQRDLMVLNALGLGLHQTMHYLYAKAPGFNEFER